MTTNSAPAPRPAPPPPAASIARDASGAVATEYALLIGGIALTIIVLVFNIGISIEGVFQIIASYLD